jgi:hypothetical protein
VPVSALELVTELGLEIGPGMERERWCWWVQGRSAEA